MKFLIKSLFILPLILLGLSGQLTSQSGGELRVPAAISEYMVGYGNKDSVQISPILFELDSIPKPSRSFFGQKNFFRIASPQKAPIYLCEATAKGRLDYFDYVCLVDSALIVQNVTVVTYRSRYGGGVRDRQWLSQFRGYGGEKILRYRKEIRGISSATISARAITMDIQQVVVCFHELKKAGFLP